MTEKGPKRDVLYLIVFRILDDGQSPKTQELINHFLFHFLLIEVKCVSQRVIW
jgi:hypothetical protein